MQNTVLAIDHGTTGTTCLVVRLDAKNPGGELLGRGYTEFTQHFPKPGWVEHDLHDIWRSVAQATLAALQAAKVPATSLAAIGITNQRETVGLWDTTGEPVHRAIVWQDRRTTERCRTLRDAGHSDLIRARTGLVIDPYFSGTKLAWLLDEVPGLRQRARAGALRFGTMDTWLLWKLTAGAAHCTDATNAARTMLFDIHANRWDPALCDLLGEIPASLLPEARACSGVFGHTRNVGFLPDGIPIGGMAGDQQAALFGQACFTPGMAKCTYGTGAFALVNTGPEAVPSQRGMLTTIAWRLGDVTTYALEGSVFVAGAIVQWLRDGLGLFASSHEVEALAESVEDTAGVVVVPALTGLGAPHWRPEARGLISGLSRGVHRGHVARAALEGIGLQVYDLLDAMRADTGAPIQVLRVDGGAAANNLLMQFQANILGIDIHRPRIVETTALGAAYLAALGVGLVADVGTLAKAWQHARSFTPAWDAATVQTCVTRWHEAVAKA